jgi:hypothetical protein
MFTLMTRANGVPIMITGTADLREGANFVLVIIITDGTVTAISTSEGTVFPAETAIGAYLRVNSVFYIKGNLNATSAGFQATSLTHSTGREITWIRRIVHLKDFAETFVFLPPLKLT